MNGWRVAKSGWTLAASALLLFGCALRFLPLTSFHGLAFDESLYRKYLLFVDADGLRIFPELCSAYIDDQRDAASATKLPPTRVLYILCGWAAKRLAFGDAPPAARDTPDWTRHDPALVSLHRVSSISGCLMLVAGLVFARRSMGESRALGVLALLTCSPLLVHMAQHPLVDGFFALWALVGLWALWEALQNPARTLWPGVLGVSVFLMVLTKENAAFVFAAFGGLLLLARWLQLGTSVRGPWLAMLLGGVFGVVSLAFVAGGVSPLVETYQLLVSKARQLPYAIKTGDGPWSRYLVDLAIFTPATVAFAIGGLFLLLAKSERAGLFLAVFVALSWTVMCNVRYGMNLRYTTVWDFPLRALACGAAEYLGRSWASRPRLGFGLVIALLCLIDLRQYWLFFIQYRIYEPTTESLLRALMILK